MKNRHVNAVVVGAGAGGGVVAKELASSGLTVVLIERGGWASYEDHDDDELISQRITALGNAFGPDDKRHCRVVVNDDGTTSTLLPSEGGYSNIAACVGSGTVSYGALAWRYMEKDFKMKTTYGHVEGSTLDDWPISFQELEPFYEKAEWEIGVAGDHQGNFFQSPRKKPYPMPPFALNREGTLLYKTAKRMKLHPFSVPMFRNSIPYNGRPACYVRRNCVGFACPVNAKGGTHNTVIPLALKTGNCELRTNCQVVEILTNEIGIATGVKYFDEKGNGQVQTADIIVVSASAIETARLLLNSKSKRFQNGLGNNNGWVGRNLQGHAYASAFGLFKNDIYDGVGPGTCWAVSDFNHGNEGIVGGGCLVNAFNPMPYLFTDVRPPGVKSWGREHKEFQAKMYRKVVELHGPCQEIPTFDAKVSVDPGTKDYWGVPVVKLSGSRHPFDYDGRKFLAARAEEILKEAGAYYTWQDVGGKGGRPGGQHQAGTCRMGNDPQTSVCDKFGRVHDVPNLFVADGSLHVNNGGFNPALTIMALGYWVGNHITSEWEKGNKFKS